MQAAAARLPRAATNAPWPTRPYALLHRIMFTPALPYPPVRICPTVLHHASATAQVNSLHAYRCTRVHPALGPSVNAGLRIVSQCSAGMAHARTASSRSSKVAAPELNTVRTPPTVSPHNSSLPGTCRRSYRMHNCSSQVRWTCYDPCAFASALLPPPALPPDFSPAASRPSPSSSRAAITPPAMHLCGSLC